MSSGVKISLGFIESQLKGALGSYVLRALSPYYTEESLEKRIKESQIQLSAWMNYLSYDTHSDRFYVGSWFNFKMTSELKGLIKPNGLCATFLVKVESLREDSTTSEAFVTHTIKSFYAEATAQYLSSLFNKEFNTDSIRPAFGYPMIPDHKLKLDAVKTLDALDKVTFTETYGIIPETSICGLIIPKWDKE